MDCSWVWGEEGQSTIYEILKENSAARRASRLAAEHVVPRMKLPEPLVTVIQRYLTPSKVVETFAPLPAAPNGDADPARQAAPDQEDLTAGVLR